MEKPLAGVRVLDFSTFVAAPVCCRLLADLGAEVIKVEHPDGDTWRKTGKNYNLEEFSDWENPVFDIYNSGKKHIALNLKTAEGMDAFHRLLARSDVFITNTRPAALKRLGISYEDLKDRYPGLVYGIVLGYGEKGPDAAKPAFDTVAFWARSGFLRDQVVLSDHYQPVAPPWGAGDTVTGLFLMGEICAALYRKKITGKGDYVRSGLYHNGIFTMGTMAIITQQPFGITFPAARPAHGVPGGAYECADGHWIYIATSYYAILIPKLCRALGREDLAENPYFFDGEKLNHKDEFYQIFKEAFLSQPAEHWIRVGEEHDIPITLMNHYSDVTRDEQAWANHYLENVTFANGKTAVMPTSPIDMDSVGEVDTHPAPRVGADTRSVLASLGFTPEEIEAMHANGSAKSSEN